MAGPVWKFDAHATGACDFCLREVEGMFVEGEVVDNALAPVRRICRDCFGRDAALVVEGELDGRVPGPAYAHNTEPLRD